MVFFFRANKSLRLSKLLWLLLILDSRSANSGFNLMRNSIFCLKWRNCYPDWRQRSKSELLSAGDPCHFWSQIKRWRADTSLKVKKSFFLEYNIIPSSVRKDALFPPGPYFNERAVDVRTVEFCSHLHNPDWFNARLTFIPDWRWLGFFPFENTA